MRILIVGGFGFIGGRLANHFSQSGHQVVLGSRNESNPPVWLPKVEVAQIKWNDEDALESSCEGVDVIIHAAGMNAQECSADPVAALVFNGVATASLVASSSRAGVKKFIYLSTAHIYSSPLVGNITEKTFPRNLHPYATSHLAGEHALLSASKRGELQGIVLRLSNAYGSPMHQDVNCWMLLVNDLCRQAVEKGEMLLNSSGSQFRDLIPMTTVCNIIHDLIYKPNIYDLYNIGSGQAMSICEMANLVKKNCEKILDKDISLSRKELKENNDEFQYNVNRLHKENIKHEINHNQEIEDLVQYCVEHFS